MKILKNFLGCGAVLLGLVGCAVPNPRPPPSTPPDPLVVIKEEYGPFACERGYYPHVLISNQAKNAYMVVVQTYSKKEGGYTYTGPIWVCQSPNPLARWDLGCKYDVESVSTIYSTKITGICGVAGSP